MKTFKVNKQVNLSQLHEEIQSQLDLVHWSESPDGRGYDGLRMDEKEDGSFDLVVLWKEQGGNEPSGALELNTSDSNKVSQAITNHAMIGHKAWNVQKLEQSLTSVGITQSKIKQLKGLGFFGKEIQLEEMGFTTTEIEKVKKLI